MRGARLVLQRVGARAVGVLLTLLATSLLVYGMLYLTPGSPISNLVNPRTATPATIAALEAKYNLDDPFFAQYANWLALIVQGDFGQSIVYKEDVSRIISARLPTTLYLLCYAGLLAVIGGLLIGMRAGLRPGLIDGVTTVTCSILIGVPAFFLAIILTTLFAITFPVFPALGAGEGGLDRLYHLTLPAITLAAGSAAFMARLARASIREESRREYVDTARSRGLPESIVVRRHVLRNSLLPIVTTGGLVVIGLVAAAPIVEIAFGLNGIGTLLIVAIQQKDLPVIQATVLLLVIGFVTINALVDAAYTLLDPRLRTGS